MTDAPPTRKSHTPAPGAFCSRGFVHLQSAEQTAAGLGACRANAQQDAASPYTCARREEQYRKMGKSSQVNITSLIAPRLC
nr:MAG TPA: hypothetical protein [Caudoviricetes sp.]